MQKSGWLKKKCKIYKETFSLQPFPINPLCNFQIWKTNFAFRRNSTAEGNNNYIQDGKKLSKIISDHPSSGIAVIFWEKYANVRLVARCHYLRGRGGQGRKKRYESRGLFALLSQIVIHRECFDRPDEQLRRFSSYLLFFLSSFFSEILWFWKPCTGEFGIRNCRQDGRK